MIPVFTGLVAFLREIFIATASLRIGSLRRGARPGAAANMLEAGGAALLRRRHVGDGSACAPPLERCPLAAYHSDCERTVFGR
jgi:hypothetical protein